MNDKASRPVATITHPTCPPWCTGEHVDDIDTQAVPPSPARRHEGPTRAFRICRLPELALLLELAQWDYDGEPGVAEVRVRLFDRDGNTDPFVGGALNATACRDTAAAFSELANTMEPPAIPVQRTSLAASLRSFLVAEAVTR